MATPFLFALSILSCDHFSVESPHTCFPALNLRLTNT